MTCKLRIAIVDDHPMVAEGIQSILESYDDVVVGALNNGRNVIELLDTLDPDVILMDLNMPDIGGLSATEIVLEGRPGTHIVILSMHDTPEYTSSALNHGAMGYILKDVPTDEIKPAINTVIQRDSYLCTGAKGSLALEGSCARGADGPGADNIALTCAEPIAQTGRSRPRDICEDG